MLSVSFHCHFGVWGGKFKIIMYIVKILQKCIFQKYFHLILVKDDTLDLCTKQEYNSNVHILLASSVTSLMCCCLAHNSWMYFVSTFYMLLHKNQQMLHMYCTQNAKYYTLSFISYLDKKEQASWYHEICVSILHMHALTQQYNTYLAWVS